MITVGTDSYISVEDANTYLALSDRSLPSDTTLAENLLKRATMSIDRVYGGRFIGVRNSSNPLEWPRLSQTYAGYGYSNTGRYLEPIPREVAQATCELALMIDTGVDPLAQPEMTISERSVQVDVISISEKGASPRRTDPLYNVTLILAPVMESGGIKLVR